MRFRSLLPFLLCLLASASGADSVKDQYRKLEYMIPMRDGIKLYTSVYVPRHPHGTSPILLERTPYSAGPYGPDAYQTGFDGSPKFVKDGFIFAFQDVRGRFMSEGDFVDVRPQLPLHHDSKDIDESTDAYDTIDYLINHVPDNNGRIGVRGISYPGFYAAAAGINSHPALRAISPQAPVSDWFRGDDWHHHGALFLQDIVGFYGSFGRPRFGPVQEDPPSVFPGVGKDAYRFFLNLGPLANINERYFKSQLPFWNQVVAHPSYDDFWEARNIRNKLRNVHCPVLTVGGLFDAEDMAGAFEVSRSVGILNPMTPNFLVMGPWYHGMWADPVGDHFGDLRFGQPTSTYFQEEVEYPFFAHYLNDAPKPSLAAATVFDTGANQWRRFAAWPPKTRRESWALESGGKLEMNAVNSSALAPDFDEYVSDPAHPVPYQDGVLTDRTREYMLADQRFAAKRADVLTYEAPPLSADVNAVGPIHVKLFVSTSGTDSDFVVKVIDEYPSDPNQTEPPTMAGYQLLVRGDIMRGRFRTDDSKPEPFVPGQVTPLNFDLNGICHTFKKGHRLMVQIQSSWFPLVDRNPNQFIDLFRATEADFKTAKIKVYHSARFPSAVEIGAIK